MPKGLIERLFKSKPYEKRPIPTQLRKYIKEFESRIRIVPFTNNNAQELGKTITLSDDLNNTIVQITLIRKNQNVWSASKLSVGGINEETNQYRSLGFAKLMLEFMKKWVKAQGGTKITFSTKPKLIAMYKHFGGKIDLPFSHHPKDLIRGEIPMSFDLTNYNPEE